MCKGSNRRERKVRDGACEGRVMQLRRQAGAAGGRLHAEGARAGRGEEPLPDHLDGGGRGNTDAYN